AGPAKKGELQHHGRQFKLEQRSNVDWNHGKAVGGVHIFRQLMTCPGRWQAKLTTKQLAPFNLSEGTRTESSQL
ncbi:hypothetical protein ACJX0J_028557, partial [Zea mays]